jgi:hypothetical protein
MIVQIILPSGSRIASSIGQTKTPNAFVFPELPVDYACAFCASNTETNCTGYTARASDFLSGIHRLAVQLSDRISACRIGFFFVPSSSLLVELG